MTRDEILKKLVHIQYERNDMTLDRGRMLSPIVLDAILSDAQIKALYQRMTDLCRYSTPKYVMQTNGEVNAVNSKEFDEAVAKIVEQIELRQQKIMSATIDDSERLLDYDEWYAIFEDRINTELAETGADREMDFDSEREFEKRYEEYLNAC